MKRFVLFSIVALLLAGCSREIRVGRKITRQFNENKIFQQAFSGLVVKDAQTGKILTNIHGEKYFTPASNTKMITLMTALAYLPDTLPSLIYEIKGDSLLFWGSGNPAFLDNRMAWDSITYRFLAENKHPLVFCSDNFKEEGLGPGWAWDDVVYRFSAWRSPMPIYKNAIHLTFDSTSNHFSTDAKIFQKNIYFVPSDEKLTLSKDGRQLTFCGKAPIEYEREVPFVYDDDYFVKILGDTLHRQVVAKGCGLPDKESKKLKTVPADSVYAIMMQESDNLMAEQLLLMSACAKTGILSEDSIIPLAQKELLAPLNIAPKWVDGSGLSRYNKFRPMDMVKVMSYLLATQPESRLQNIFPQGHTKGSIKDWYPNYVFAKTGTMTGVHSLTGWMTTQSGKKIIFSFMHNNYLSSSKLYKPEMRKLLEWIWKEY
ncbi:MAG TPA: hypothetical protein ENK85_01780 [Saprospiraceae bacterium]|nr:hypothetical protein [Saprospiraceae bacterium]